MAEVTRRRKRPPRRPPEPAPQAAEADEMRPVEPDGEPDGVLEQSSHTAGGSIASEAGAGDVEAPQPEPTKRRPHGPIGDRARRRLRPIGDRARRRLRPIGDRARRRLKVAAGALLVAGLVAAVAVDTDPSVRERLAAYADASGRHPLASAGGRFRAQFPSQPERSTSRSTFAGIEVTTVTHRADVGLDNSFLVSYLDLPGPPADPATALLAAATTTATVVKGELSTTTPTTKDGRPALEAVTTVRLEGGTAGVHHSRTLLVLDGARLYSVTVIDTKDPPAGYDAFVQSFAIVSG